MDKLTDIFIANAGKATQKPEVFYDAFTPEVKRYHWADDLTIKPSTAFKVIAAVMFIVFAWWLV